MRNISTICLNVLGEKQPWNWGKMGILPDDNEAAELLMEAGWIDWDAAAGEAS